MQPPAASGQRIDVDLGASRGGWLEEASLEQVHVKDAAQKCSHNDSPNGVCARFESHSIDGGGEELSGVARGLGRICSSSPSRRQEL